LVVADYLENEGTEAVGQLSIEGEVLSLDAVGTFIAAALNSIV